MAKINILYSYSEIDAQQWDELDARTPYGSFFQTREAYRFFNKIDGLEPFVFALEHNGKLQGLISGVIQREAGKIKSVLTRRAIVYGGPLLSADICSEHLVVFLKQVVKLLKGKAIYIEIRNLHRYEKYKEQFKEAGFVYKKHLNFKVNCSNGDELLKRMSKSKRRQIRKGLKGGAEIVEATKSEEVVRFYEILNNLYKEKVKTPLFNKDFFIRFFELDLGKYLLVKYKDQIIGGIMSPVYNNKIIYEWFVCGLDQKYKNLYPSILATWAAMDFANKNNIKTFDFMGAGSPDKDYGVREFKSKFGGELVEEGRYIDILNPFLYKIGELGVKILKRLK